MNTEVTDICSPPGDGDSRLPHNNSMQRTSLCLYTSVSPRGSSEVVHCIRKSHEVVLERTSNGSRKSLPTDGDHKALILLCPQVSSASEMFQEDRDSSSGVVEFVPLQDLASKTHSSGRTVTNMKNSRSKNFSDRQ